MATELKIRRFASEPMDNKLVTQVAGVGPVAKLKLNNKGVITAEHLYEKFRNLRFDEKRFREWFLKICPGARAAVVYRSLVAWRDQHDSDTSASEPQPSTSRGVRRADPRQRRGRAATFERHPNSPQAPEANTNQQPNNLDPFIALISNLLPNIAPDLRTDYMGKVLNITKEYEQMTRNRHASAQMPPPSAPA